MPTLIVNGQSHNVNVEPDTPLKVGSTVDALLGGLGHDDS